MGSVRTRFAPSPTGYLHLGSARTALFNWAYARRWGGQLVLRIEDTDRERSTRESERALLSGLEWLGIHWDEGPLRQSERSERYAEAVEELLARGRAYRCRCTAEELEERKQATIAAGGKWTYDGRCRDLGLGPDCGPHTVRLRLPPDEPLDFDDAVYGPSGQSPLEIGDRILRRSDGTAVYHLAVVVDDLDMGISHVIRGVDHQINTSVQLAIYRALGREAPRFAHVPLIVGEGGKKLSKRRDAASVEAYRDGGYLADALLNWLVRIGWSHGDQEIFSREEIRSLFALESVSRAPARADADKLDWLNQHYLKALPVDALWEALQPFARAVAQGPVDRTPALEKLLELLRERSRTLQEMAERAAFALRDPIVIDEKAAGKHLKPAAEPLLRDLHDDLARLDDWAEPAIEAVFEAVRARHGDVSMGRLAQPVRVAVTGTATSPGIFETLAVLGRQRSVERIGSALERIRSA